MRWRPDATLTLLAAGLALAWAAVVAYPEVAGLSSPLDRFEEACLDLRALLSPRRPVPPDTIVVALDDDTIRMGGAFPLPRNVLTTLIEAIARRKPKAIILDLLFLDPGPPAADAALAQALTGGQVVIAAAGTFGDGDGRVAHLAAGAGDLPVPDALLWPIEPMAGAADVGLVNLSAGVAGMPRHVPLLFGFQDRVIPSIVLLAAALATGTTPKFAGDSVSLGDRHIALDRGRTLALRLYGPRGTIPTVSGTALLAVPLGAEPPGLEGRTVVVGSTATGGGDSFPTPFSTRMPGVELLATAIDNLLAGDNLVRTRWTRWLGAGGAVVLALAAVALIALRRSVVALGLVLMLAAAWAAVTLLAFMQGYWLSTAVPITAMAPVAALYGSARLWRERYTASRLAVVERGLRPFQARPMADLLAKDPALLAEPVTQDAAVLFVDLSGYTTLSEANDPMTIRRMLKGFHALVDATVDECGGFVGTFLGDGAMILFGVPVPHPHDAARALGALAALEERLHQWGTGPDTGLNGQVRARLAAHFGPVVVSRLGGRSHQQITVTGDTVNVASRLLEVAKLHHVATVISERIVEAAGGQPPPRHFPQVTEVPIRGRSHPVAVRLRVPAEP